MRSNADNHDFSVPVSVATEICVHCSGVFDPTTAQAPELFICDDCYRDLRRLNF